MTHHGFRKFVRTQAVARARVLDKQFGLIKKHTQDPDWIHDLRVAIRRYTQCLRLFSPCWKKSETRAIRDSLTPLMDLLGEVRNYDIALDLLQTLDLQQAREGKTLATRRTKAQGDLLRHLKHFNRKKRFTVRTRKLAFRKRARKQWEFEQSAEENALRVLPSMSTEMTRMGNQAAKRGAPADVIHRFRLRVKRYRYSLEIFETMAGVPGRGELQRLKELQELLGAVNDCAIVLPMLRQSSASYAAISKELAARIRKFRHYWNSMPTGNARLARSAKAARSTVVTRS